MALNLFSKSVSMIVGQVNSDGGVVGVGKEGDLLVGTRWQCILFGTKPGTVVVQVSFSHLPC